MEKEIQIMELLLHKDPNEQIQSNLIQCSNMHQNLQSLAMSRTLDKVGLYFS